MYRDVCRVEVVNVEKGAATLRLSEMATVVARSDTYLACFRGLFLGIYHLTGVTGEVDLDGSNRKHGEIEYTLRWLSKS